MKNYGVILPLALLFILTSCNTDDCGECFTPPQSFIFEIVNIDSGENLFTNGTYNSSDITIINTLNTNEAVEFRFISENDVNLIQIGAIGWEKEVVNLKIEIGGNPIFNFYVDAERKSSDCCSYTDYNDITIADSDFELNPQTGIYKIFVE